MALTFRTATEDDLDRLVDIHTVAYPDPERGHEVRLRNLATNAFGGLEHLVVAVDGEELVAHAFLFPMRAYFGGRVVKLGGIASVAVAPEARGRGVATALLHELHARSDARREALTMLYAYRQGFYARLGYAATSSRKRLAVDPASIPRELRASSRDVVRRASGDDARAIQRAYEQTGAASSGWLVRPPALWERLFARERRQHLVATRGKRVTGYVAFEVVQPEPHAETRLVVEELAATDDEARRGLWAALGAMRDQVAEIDVEVAADDPIDHALVDPDRRRHGRADVEHAIGEVVAGPMVRVEDVPRAIEARGYTGSGSFDVELEPEDDAIAVSVRIADGRAEVGPARGRAPFRTTRRGLAAVLYGGLRPADAVAIGMASGDPRTVARMTSLVALPPLTPVDPF